MINISQGFILSLGFLGGLIFCEGVEAEGKWTGWRVYRWGVGQHYQNSGLYMS